MNQYTVVPAPVGGPDWGGIPTMAVDCRLWTQPVDITMKCQLAYDREGIYVHQRAWEKAIRAEELGPLPLVCKDSCMEFFFCPQAGDRRYFNFEINPKGHMYIGFGLERSNRVRLSVNDEDGLFSKVFRLAHGGWEVFYRIPVSFVREFFREFSLESGMGISANCFKCGDLTEIPHYFSWNPIASPTPDFHRPEDFGQLRLG